MKNKKLEKIAIISGGVFSPLRGIEEADFIIACDKGLKYALDSKVQVDLFVGDRDSLDIAVPNGINTLDLPVEKDDTDMMAATRFAISLSPLQITFYCACGGRYDHFLGNLQAAAFAAKNVANVAIIDLNGDFFIFSSGVHSFKKCDNRYFSVLSLSDKCEGVCISGAKYPLQNATIKNDFPIGISNEWLGDDKSEITVSLKSGVLAVITSKN